MEDITTIDDQPIAATFFGEGKWLSEFITPNAMEVQNLYRETARGISQTEGKIATLHKWVARNIRYKKFITGVMTVEGERSVQKDLWMNPSMVIRTGVGNCANKAFLLTSLLRNELGPNEVYSVLGNLYNGHAGGHAWTQVRYHDRDYIVDPTCPTCPSMVLASMAERYEPVHFFNDNECYAIQGRTLMQPFTACYSTWLVDYLDKAYIEGRK